MITQQYIKFNQSNVRHLPVNFSRSPKIGDILRFTGEVKQIQSINKMTELLVFIDTVTGDEVTMSISTLMRAHGTVRLFFKNFSYVDEALERAISTKLIFCVKNIETREIKTPNEIINIKKLTIDCEN